ncbi:helix-turn-helix domain-containing protein [Pseudomonas syringae]|uniref:helix-turn-helix domain-containing protein n=1 Tax=Pseudomonas syringae TaxID=317 RepID=UPI000B282AE5|nr:transcriptional regulator [Pseudomonas syringae]
MRIRKDMKGMNCLGERLVNHIDSPEDYQSKLDVIEKLTDGQALTPVESNLLDILCDTVELYENRAPQLSAFNARIEGLSEVDLIKALMLQNKLTGADLPEIGDKSVVSRILNGERKLTVEMVARLATRFHLSPGAVIH